MKKALVTLGLVLLIGLVGVVVWLYPRETIPPPPIEVAVSAFEEIPVDFTHRWVNEEGAFPFLGAAVLDVEGDGTLEVFVSGSDGQPDALLYFEEGALHDRIAGTGLSEATAAYGATALDLDADGDTDLIVARHDGVYRYTNDGGVFTSDRLPVTLDAEAVPFSVAVSDIDRDGDGDLYVSAFVDITAFRSATFNDPDHAKHNVLLRNDGGSFTDITASSGTAGLQNTFLSVFVDLDGDRFQDLVVAQNTGEVELFRNRGDTTFEPVATNSGFGFWMSLAVGDIDNDGDQDLFFSNAGNSVPDFLLRGDLRDDQRLETNWLLLRNDGAFQFTDVSEAYGLRDFAFAWGATFEDLNLDGLLDLLVAQNYIQLPNFKLRRVPGKAMAQVAHAGDNGFYHLDAWGLNNPYFAHAPLIADFNGDGRPDVLWLNMDGPARAFLNNSSHNYVSVALPDDVATLGTTVRVETDAGVSYARQVLASVGFMTDQTPELVFGLGAYAGHVTLTLERPDSTVVVMDSVAVNQRLRVPDGP